MSSSTLSLARYNLVGELIKRGAHHVPTQAAMIEGENILTYLELE